MKFYNFAVISICFFLLGCNSASDQSANIDRLATLLTGEFDSGQQLQSDRLTEIAKDNRHGWVNRVFVRVEAPDIGTPVLVGSTRYGGEKWIFDDNEFLVWTFEPQNGSDDIIMSPQRFKALEAKKPHVRDAAKLGGFTNDDLVPAISGAACKIIWTPSETGFLGKSQDCQVMSTTHKEMLNWNWTYDLGSDGVVISYAGMDDNGKIFEQTPIDKPYILNRLERSSEYHNGRFILFNPKDRSDYGRAITLLETAVKQDPDHAEAQLMLAYAYTKQSKYENAQTHLQIAQPLKADLSEQDRLWLEALDARIDDDYPRDIAAWEALVAKYPEDRWAWYELASIYYRSEDYATSISAIDNALKAEPDEKFWGASYIYYLQSKSYFRAGDYARAIAASEPGIRNKATRRATYYRKAMAQIASGEITDPTEAIETYKTYSKRNGKLNEAVFLTSVALFFHELGDYDKAIDYARKGYAVSQGPYQSWTLGFSLTEKGEPQAALPYFDKAIAAFPDNVNLYAGKGWAHYRLGDFKTAEKFLLNAQTLSKRKNSGIERDLKIVKAALADPNAPQAAPVRWFGD